MNRKEQINCVNDDKLSACTYKDIHSFKEKTLKDEVYEKNKHTKPYIIFTTSIIPIMYIIGMNFIFVDFIDVYSLENRLRTE